MSTGAPLTVRGTCAVMFAYDVAFGIDLDKAQQMLSSGADGPSQREAMKHSRRTPKYFEFHPRPLRITRPADPITLGEYRTRPNVDVVLYDFGALCVSYEVDLAGPLVGLLGLSDVLYENRALLEDSRARVESLVRSIHGALQRPKIAPIVEDYQIYQLGSLPPGPAAGADTAAEFLRAHGAVIAQILRSDRQELSQQEIQDALSTRISYSPRDLSIIDWNASILFLDEFEDVRTVLEFANVELLEMRQLDDQLDLALDRSYRTLTENESRRNLPTRLFMGSDRGELRRVAEWQMDSSLLFENVNNAIKLLGDQYLARVYRLAASRLHLPEWDASILRKLQVLEGIYEKLADRQTNRRMEILEWIIILLIAFEIVLSLVTGALAR